MESSRRDGYDGYFTWGGALLQPELWEIHPKIAISGHNPPIFTRDNDIGPFYSLRTPRYMRIQISLIFA